MPTFSGYIFEWIKPLKRSEKHKLKKVLLKEGYDSKSIRFMDTHLRRKLWKMWRERTKS